MTQWTPAPIPLDEHERQRRLARLGLRPSDRYPFLDAVIAIAAEALQVPMVLVSLLESDRQWFAAEIGLGIDSTGRAESFCGHCILGSDPMAVPDTTLDPRFAANPLVTGEPYIQAYLGVPLFAGPAQSGVGTLCVLDRQPRAWSAEQARVLRALGALIEGHLDGLAYQRVWEDSPLSVLLLDSDGQLVRTNPAFGRMVGRRVDEVLDKPVDRLVLAADRAVFGAMHRHALVHRTSPTRRELRFVKLGGEVVNGGVSMSPVRDHDGLVVAVIRDISLERRIGARSGVVAAVREELSEPLSSARASLAAARQDGATAAHLDAVEARLDEVSALLDARIGDIAARVNAEAKLAASEQRTRSLMEHMLGKLLVIDDRGRIVDANSAALDALGWRYDALVGASLRAVVPAFSDVEGARWFELATESAAGTKLPEPLCIARRDGTELLVELRMMAMDWNGPGRLILLARDITAERKHAASLVKERDDLATEVRSRQATVDQLQKVEADLKASLEEKETMLKEIHHRVKNNLQMVASLLTLQLNQVDDAHTREALAESVRRVRSMALIHQHLYGSVSLERVELGAYARTLAQTLHWTLAPHALVETEVDAVDIPVDVAIPVCLLLNELLTNALKYGVSPPEGARPPPWNVRVIVDGRRVKSVRIVVQDRGPGLPEGFRLEGHASLGLRLVHTLARQIRAEVTPRNDGGACFEVIVPLQS